MANGQLFGSLLIKLKVKFEDQVINAIVQVMFQYWAFIINWNIIKLRKSMSEWDESEPPEWRNLIGRFRIKLLVCIYAMMGLWIEYIGHWTAYQNTK